MTRINVVPPTELVNKHCMAEYREAPRIITEALKKIKKGIQPGDLIQPSDYTLGKGHVLFFVTRIGWIVDRIVQLHDELKHRGFNLNEKMYNEILSNANRVPYEWCDWYEPTDNALLLNRQRISERLSS